MGMKSLLTAHVAMLELQKEMMFSPRTNKLLTQPSIQALLAIKEAKWETNCSSISGHT